MYPSVQPFFFLQRSYHQPAVPLLLLFRHELHDDHSIFPAGFSSTRRQNKIFPVQIWLPYYPTLQRGSYLDSLQRSCWNIAGPGESSFLIEFSVSAILSACIQNKNLSWSSKYAKSCWGSFLPHWWRKTICANLIQSKSIFLANCRMRTIRTKKNTAYMAVRPWLTSTPSHYWI